MSPHLHHHAPQNYWQLALSATWHCLLGCGLGEVTGMIISTIFNFGNTSSIVLALILGFVGGLVLGVGPWLKAGMTTVKAIRQVIYVEGLSIGVMETAEAITEIYTPGVMSAHLGEPIFWIGMILALSAGFLAALPINYLLARRGIRHQH